MSVSYQTVTIANGTTTSNAIVIPDGYALISLSIPTMTGTTIALQGSYDNTTWQPIYMDNTAQTITVVASSKQSINPRATLGFTSVKLVSGSSEGADRLIKVAIVRVV